MCRAVAATGPSGSMVVDPTIVPCGGSGAVGGAPLILRPAGSLPRRPLPRSAGEPSDQALSGWSRNKKPRNTRCTGVNWRSQEALWNASEMHIWRRGRDSNPSGAKSLTCKEKPCARDATCSRTCSKCPGSRVARQRLGGREASSGRDERLESEAGAGSVLAAAALRSVSWRMHRSMVSANWVAVGSATPAGTSSLTSVLASAGASSQSPVRSQARRTAQATN